MATAIGSGLDLPKLVESLVGEARKAPAARINQAGTAATAKLSSVGKIKQVLNTLKSSLQTLMDRADKPTLAVKVPSDAGFTATGSADAVPGLYSVKVERLASAHKLVSDSLPEKPGAGTVDIKSGDHTVSVPVSANDTLADIAKAINQADGGKAVVASVVKSDDGEHLVLSARHPGTDNALAVTGTGAFASFAAEASEVEAKDAVVIVDGLTRTISSNSVGDLIPGVNLALTQAKSGVEYVVEVKPDEAALKSDLDGFVKAWNDANAVLKKVSAFDPAASPDRRASPLTGDALVRGLQQQLRGQVSSHLTELRALGVSVDKDGVMKVDAGEFKNADLSEVKATLGKQGQYTDHLKKMLEGQLNSTDGTVILRERGLNQEIKGYESQLDALDSRMQQLSERYTAQFSAMERMIVQMQSSAGSLDNLLSSMQK